MIMEGDLSSKQRQMELIRQKEMMDIVMSIIRENKTMYDRDFEKASGIKSPAERMEIYNKLLSQGKMVLFMDPITKDVSYSFPSEEKKLAGLGHEERLLYQIIEDSGNKGIWTRDIKIKSNVNPTKITKYLKTMETRKLIKAVKSVSSAKRKVYMLFDIEPDRSLTGGAWYSDNDFELEMAEVLLELTLRFVKKKASNAAVSLNYDMAGSLARYLNEFVTVDEVAQHIRDSKIINVELAEDETITILDALVFDGQLERNVVPFPAWIEGNDSKLTQIPLLSIPEGSLVFRAVSASNVTTGVLYAPCGSCPVASECHEHALINPQTCQYLRRWLADGL